MRRPQPSIPEFDRVRPARTRRPRTARAAAKAVVAGVPPALPFEAPAAAIAPEDRPVASRRPQPSPPVAQQPLVVATADPSLMRMLMFALEQHHLPCQPFTSGSAVLEALLSMPRGGPPAVVLLDVDLPGVDGHAILERLGVERPESYLIVVLSSHADESTQVRSLLAGALDHLAKPFNVRVLMAKLRRWTAIARRSQAA